ncbi:MULTISPECIES: hypothetical protein [Cycloclasticus]|jgi:hypothetical protein|uniref:Uncharacterized protein n=1 Tax=Cycloclasticus pugetii TaxID=34068 RepID=A0AB33Z3C2_9GAMM|nr:MULTISPECIES: hypothetical protein [Cycloclasticus]ATI03142.1 hypothetical protein CPC19_06545 [Cycloclasticus sp. PY97N]EPD13417.1 hypothetical protein L196_05176 [Cycloclasticus pugetii]
MTDRFLVPAYGPDEKALGIALQSLGILGNKYNSDIALVVPALKHADGTILKRLIPEQQLKELSKGKTLLFGEDNIPLSMVSPLTLNKTRAQVILGVFASKKMINKIESKADLKAIIILPWAGEADIKEWKDTYSPTILESNEKT